MTIQTVFWKKLRSTKSEKNAVSPLWGTKNETETPSAIILESIAGYDPKDSSSVNVQIPNYTEDIENGINGFRLIHCPDLIQTEIDSEIFESFENSLKI